MSRIIATSDWHGLADRARALIAETGYDPKTDDLVILGDMIDRGPDSLGCIRYAQELQRQGAIVLMGNHEDMAMRAYKSVFKDPYHPKYEGDDLAFHLNNGGDKFWDQSFMEKPNMLEIIRWMESLPPWYRIVWDMTYFFVHAGWDFDRLPSAQRIDDLLWERDALFRRPVPDNCTVVFGHTPTNHLRPDRHHLVFRDRGLVGVDCGGVFGGNLAAISLPDGREYYA